MSVKIQGPEPVQFPQQCLNLDLFPEKKNKYTPPFQSPCNTLAHITDS